jgi:hypothetical protein
MSERHVAPSLLEVPWEDHEDDARPCGGEIAASEPADQPVHRCSGESKPGEDNHVVGHDLIRNLGDEVGGKEDECRLEVDPVALVVTERGAGRRDVAYAGDAVAGFVCPLSEAGHRACRVTP